jgi:serine/threonine protein kinase
MVTKLQFRRVTGQQVEVEAQVDDAEFPAGEYLMARKVSLDDRTELRQHRPASGSQRREGYERLDSEILAGRRLYEVADWASYPPEVASLYGDEAVSAEPYALLRAYRGEPLKEVGRFIIDDELDDFQVSLLTGLCWLAAAGVAHRVITPDTVLWDSSRRRVQITDFSRSAIFGVPRTAVTGSQAWVPKEQRPGTCYGTVGPRDDVWAAGKLIAYVRNQGEDLLGRDQLADLGLDVAFNGMFDRVLGPPEGRPTAWELLEDGLGRRSHVPAPADGSGLMARRARFLAARQRCHPGAPEPPQNFNEDLDWAR